MIGRAMERWPDDALRRVVDAPVETWMSEFMWRAGRGCLLGHACGYGRGRASHEEAAVVLGIGDGRNALSIGLSFDGLCDRFGIPRTVRAIKQRALAILLRRHPLSTTHTPHESAVKNPAPTASP